MLKAAALGLVCALVACGDNKSLNEPPIAGSSAISVTVVEDGSVMIDSTATDPEGDPLTYTASSPEHGTITGAGPIFTYAPSANYNGDDGLTITISDGENDVTVSVLVTVTAVDDAPVAQSIAVTTNEDQGVSVLLAATDVDSSAFTYTVTVPPMHGTLTGQTPALTYTPDHFYSGSDSFQYTANDGMQDSAPGTVSITVTHVLTCGDGIVEGSEQCDDGNTDQTDACLNNCMLATCGDGFVETGVEQCDDGNSNPADGCTNTCTTPRCGDGIVQTGEQCDDGNASNNDACLNTCVAASCGDGFVDTGVEQCDDGNASNNDACLNSCQAASCGDGFVFIGFEQCDDGNHSNNDACLDTCVNAFCGDGFVEIGVEQCDDANASNNDACLNSCQIATCGDGFVQTGVEQCDDANASNNDACLNTCQEATCGDGFVQLGVEQCDDGNHSNNDACLNTCAEATCGDGFVQTGVEQCDDGNHSNNDACLNSCANATCGDGFVETGSEQCDDGNTVNTDACLNSCVVATCGDGVVEAGIEQCDDGNTVNTDACLNSCVAATCGDGVVETGVEDCDDGNTNDDDGCTHTCKTEGCGDGLVQFALGEECDDGNTADNDGCDSSCQAEAYTTTEPALISGALNCNTGIASNSEKVAVDSDGRIYVSYMCGSSGFFSVSTDRGQTFSLPFDLSANVSGEIQLAQIAIGAGEVGTVHAMMLRTDGGVLLRSSTDFGATWTEGAALGTASNTSTGISLDAFNDDVFVGFESAGGISVQHSRNEGGTFTTTIASLTTAAFDLIYDVRTHIVGAVASSPPSFRILLSGDEGATFAGEVNPPGQEFFSDWAISNGEIFVSGTNIGLLGNSTQLYIIPASAPTTSVAISGLPQVSTLQSRSLTADANGNAYVVSQLNGGGIQLDRLAFGATALDPARSLTPTGTEGVAAPLPGGSGVAVIYTEGTQVWATVQAY
ncbi:MAG TPA: DUF4215 domain-containing protein [Kofleriaceae bacterium]|jgi:cysteine-rich repeat protein